ncbi:Branched-chain amino acid ABC-type transport system permease component [Gaiella occulta]|uniref:Branched-chain amino acid ABC-type transport system permease component n=1 Tax=Gaiella occulta TaxID=1002870 RepID=A0A7M2YTL8_9ACTN|nr:branched-chain amino acid ABC transporter permease [Gaiella occulta]RDI73433.1 Branched-chain amino acid ABC-type transport system permease component [Gaiella occulta]
MDKARTSPRRLSVPDTIGLAFVALLLVWLAINFVKGPQEFVNVALIGLTNGAIYGLVALGYTLVYGILQLINFAHGDVFALAGLVASSVIVSVLGLDTGSSIVVIVGGLLVTLVLIMSGFALFNASIERIAYRPLRNAPRLAPLITAIGMSFIVQNISLAFYGVDYQTVPNFISRSPVFEVGSVSYSWNKLTVLIIVVPLLVLLTWFVTSTRQGKAMRAVAQDTEASAMMGIDVNRTIGVTFMIAGALAGGAGIVYLLQFNMRYDTGFQLGLIAFTAAVLGGIGNLAGAVLGALTIGFIEAFNEGLTWNAPGSDWTRTIVFAILILILVFRPEGLLGERTPEGA